MSESLSSTYLRVLESRILVFDGAMGTSIQKLGLSEADFGGPGLDGCNDHLVLSRPDAIESIHASFLEVGCDVLETNTFRANRLTLREYGLQDCVVEMNRTAAQLARRAADGFASAQRPRFVAGSIGPSGFLPSTSDPTLGNITFEELAGVFAEQARGLVEGGVDVLLIETSQDILEVKAQIAGIRRFFRESGVRVPIQAQVTLDTSERMLLGTDIAASLVILEAMRADIVGLNCSTGPEHMRQPVHYLCEHARKPISVIPNAGIPHNEGGTAIYPLTPAELADAHDEFVTRIGVSIVGGCCGTTPEHLRAVVERVWGRAPLARKPKYVPRAASAMTAFAMHQDPPPTLIGERVNTQGSRAVKRLLLADDYEGVLEVARDQVEGGAHLLDVCVALTERQDEADQMATLVKLLAQSVETPLVIDTTEADVAEAALRRYPGRAIINSINLESGRERIDRVVPIAVEHGASLIALTIDEQGMAKTADRKLEIARRIHDIVTIEYGLEPEALIFDDLTFTLATGDAEFRRSGIETIEGIRRTKAELPGVLTSLGVSNVSFGLSRHARAVLNSVFLHHCIEAGLDMAIVNPAHITPYAEIDEEQRALADDLIFDRREDALPRFIAHFENVTVEEEAATDPTADMEPEEAIHWKILHRKKEDIEEWIDRAVRKRIERIARGDGSGDSEWVGGGAPTTDVSTSSRRQGSATLERGLEPDSAGSSQRDVVPHEPSRSASPQASVESVDAAGDGQASVQNAAGVWVLNHVLLPAMREVGDKFGAGELILPFVLQSAEVMKRAVARLETYLDKVEGQTKGRVVLATVFGDVHDIGKSLVNTILTNNGYTVYDLGKQVPVNTIIEKAVEVGADAIGLSALLVSTSKQMPLCVKELHARGLRFPVLIGGAAINPSFGRMASFVDVDQTELYPTGVYYCKDAFEGLASVDALVDPARRDDFIRTRHDDVRAGVAKRAALVEKARAARPARAANTPGRDIEIPPAPFFGVKVLDRLPLADLFRFIDLNTLYRLHWGAKNAKGEHWERLVRDEFEPRLERYRREALAGRWVTPRAVYGFYPAAADGDALVVFDPVDENREVARFGFPRQSDRDELCLADYFAELGNGRRDVVAFQLITIGDSLLTKSDAMMKGGDYGEGYYLHGFGVRLAEAGAEYVHRLIRKELSLPMNRGLRYSWGYPACPDHLQHHTLFRLLPARERLGMEVTEAGALVPELSTAALVVHHPEAKYFSP
ncbi:MAG: homocysteine S-methyltransferase family protein [Gemmatimonadetes bacterium]|nr:homocysteine S-methyltransferase family protein [Gemmatimonadota bacterium]